MGRAERRRLERRNRIENRKGKVLLSRNDITDMKERIADDITEYSAESLLTCFALAEHRLYGFGKTRILKTLQYIDDLMGDILNDTATIEDYKKQLEDETGVSILCGEEK